jgi:hypothetical protein
MTGYFIRRGKFMGLKIIARLLSHQPLKKKQVKPATYFIINSKVPGIKLEYK